MQKWSILAEWWTFWPSSHATLSHDYWSGSWNSAQTRMVSWVQFIISSHPLRMHLLLCSKPGYCYLQPRDFFQFFLAGLTHITDFVVRLLKNWLITYSVQSAGTQAPYRNRLHLRRWLVTSLDTFLQLSRITKFLDCYEILPICFCNPLHMYISQSA